MLENVGGAAENLNGWNLVSERGNQGCALYGVLEAGDTVEVWARSEDADRGGINCGYGDNIWNNSEPDPAVLYNAQGVEVNRK